MLSGTLNWPIKFSALNRPIKRTIKRKKITWLSCLCDLTPYRNVLMQRALKYEGRSTTTTITTFLFSLPAERVLAADHLQLQTVGLLFIFIGTIRHYCLPSPLCAALGLAGAEEKPVAELGWHTIQEWPQSFVAALLVARFALVGVLLDAGGDEGGTLPFAAAVEIAGFDCIEAGVAVFFRIKTVEPLWSHCEHPWKQAQDRKTWSWNPCSGTNSIHDSCLSVVEFQPSMNKPYLSNECRTKNPSAASLNRYHQSKGGSTKCSGQLIEKESFLSHPTGSSQQPLGLNTEELFTIVGGFTSPP